MIGMRSAICASLVAIIASGCSTQAVTEGSLSMPSEAHINVSDKTMAAFKGPLLDTLLRYLASNPRWQVREGYGFRYAVRVEAVEGQYQPNQTGCYRSGSGRNFRQTRVCLYLGRPNVAMGVGRRTEAKVGCEDVSVIVEGPYLGMPAYSSYTLIEGGSLYLEIMDQKPSKKRTFTQKAFNDLSEELQDVLKYHRQIADTGLMPVRTRYPRALPTRTFVDVNNGTEPGIYWVTAGIRPTCPGVAYVKVIDTESDTPLSPDETATESLRHVGWSKDGQTCFAYDSHVIIYGANPNKRFEARFELWHRADSGAEVKLGDSSRIITGWSR